MNEESKFLFKHEEMDLEDFVKNTPHFKSGKEYVLDCPLCLANELNGYNKLYIKEDFSVGYCQRCKSTFHNKDNVFKNEPIDEFVIPTFEEEKEFSIERINIDYYNNSSEFLQNEYDWLIHRNPTLKSLYKKLGFKFRPNKCVIPFYWDNSIIYYQIRATLPRKEAPLPYFCPPIDHKPCWFNPLNTGSNKLILVEGVFGAIGAWLKYNKEYDVVSVQGSNITKYQLWMLDHKMYSEYFMYFDDYELSYHNKKILNKHNPLIYDNIKIIKSEYGDPEDDYLGRSVKH